MMESSHEIFSMRLFQPPSETKYNTEKVYFSEYLTRTLCHGYQI